MRANRSMMGVAAVALALGWSLASPAWAVYDPGKIQAQGVYAELATTPVHVGDGWEYIVDFYTGGNESARYGIWGPDTLYENMTNIDYGATWYWGTQDIVMQFWDQAAANRDLISEFKPPSVKKIGFDEWELTEHPWAMLNTWHAPSEYATGWEANHTTLVTGKDAGDNWIYGELGQDLLQVMNVGGMYGHGAGLWFTVRIVSSEILPSLEWSLPSYGQNITWSESVWLDHPDYVPGVGVDFDHNGTNDIEHGTYGLYPILSPTGNFDDDWAINELDIDLLADAIRTGSTDFDLFDISADGLTAGADGVIDINDLDYLVRFLVATSVGTGTEYGDFNLDGVIDTTDLTRLATNYGADDWGWDDGNANRYIDTNIDNTDLTILATYYGFGEPDTIPEPMTLSLLAVGASGLAATRRSKIRRGGRK